MCKKTKIKCILCESYVEVNVNPEGIENWRKKRDELPLIQHHFHWLSPQEREIILSGICGECYDEVFADE